MKDYSSPEEAQIVLDYINEFTIQDEEPTFTLGEEVLVRDNENDEWESRLYLCTTPQAIYPYLCVDSSDEDHFKK